MSTPIHSYLIDGCIKCWQFTSPFFKSKWISLSIFSKKPQNTKLTYLTTSCYTSSLCETWALWLGSDTSTEDILHSCHASAFQRAVSLTRAKIRPVPNPHRGERKLHRNRVFLTQPIKCLIDLKDKAMDCSAGVNLQFLVLPPPNLQNGKTMEADVQVAVDPPGATPRFPSKRRHLPCKNKWNMSTKVPTGQLFDKSRVPGQCAPGGQRSFDSMTLR